MEQKDNNFILRSSSCGYKVESQSSCLRIIVGKEMNTSPSREDKGTKQKKRRKADKTTHRNETSYSYTYKSHRKAIIPLSDVYQKQKNFICMFSPFRQERKS